MQDIESRHDARTPSCREDKIARDVVRISIQIHRELGPGLLESVYEVILERELGQEGYSVKRQVPLKVDYKDMSFEEGFKADLLVDDLVILELKAVEELKRVHHRQLFTYLKLTDKRLGMLLNFGAPLMKDGIHRIAYNLPELTVASWRHGVRQKPYA